LSDRPPDGPKRDLTVAGPVAVISCVHGNLPALEAVYADIRSQGIGQIICLGDLVGYGPWPGEVVDFVRREAIPTIQGCWDEGIGQGKGDCGCHFVSEADQAAGKWSYEWTQRSLDEAQKQYLGSLPPSLTALAGGARLVAVHGSPRSAHEYLTQQTHELVLLERAGAAQADVLLFGHTHVPYVKRLDGALRVLIDTAPPPGQPAPEPDRPVMKPLRPKLFVNAGSVGEPRHGTPDATYVVIDPASLDVSIRLVEYDVAATTRAMRKAEMPAAFAERLQQGQELAVKDKTMACDC